MLILLLFLCIFYNLFRNDHLIILGIFLVYHIFLYFNLYFHILGNSFVTLILTGICFTSVLNLPNNFSICSILEPPKKPSSPRRRTKLEKYRQERAAALAGTPKGMNVAEDDFYKLIEVDELKYQLQVKKIQL